MGTSVHRKLTFYAWRDGLKRRPFDRLAAAKGVKDLEGDPESVVEVDGGEITMELVDQPYGNREFAVRDPEGHTWSFGTYEPR